MANWSVRNRSSGSPGDCSVGPEKVSARESPGSSDTSMDMTLSLSAPGGLVPLPCLRGARVDVSGGDEGGWRSCSRSDHDGVGECEVSRFARLRNRSRYAPDTTTLGAALLN